MDNILKDIFSKQNELNCRCGKDSSTITTDEELTDWIAYYLAALYNESEELRSHTKFKAWKVYDKPIDRNQLKIEIVDMLHFLVSLALPIMTADEIADLYMAKNRLNHHRQNVGYDDKYQAEYKQPGNEDNDHLFHFKANVRLDPTGTSCFSLEDILNEE